MDYPEFIRSFPALDVPFPEDIVKCHAIQSPAGLVVFFEFFKDFTLPMHHHKAQWGSVIEGEIELTIGDETRRYGPGDSYSIPSGVEHGGHIKAGSKVIDVFEEADRYPLKG